MTLNANPCFCCSDIPFSECCEPILQDHAKALTPEMLMRSRYTAYVLENESYLLATWAPSTRPAALSLEENRVKWLKLTILSSSEDRLVDNTGKVEFSANFLQEDQLCKLHETSNFRRDAGLWYYVDGDANISRKKIGRNGLCPCGSGKKFKRCCLVR
jgi:SEC-C motif-containing protein